MGVLCMALAATAVQAQQPAFVLTVPHPAGLTRLVVDTPGLLVTGTTGTPARSTYVRHPSGRFQLWTGPNVPTGGNPFIAGDENRNIASVVVPGPAWGVNSFTSKVTLSVDGQLLDPYELMFNQTADTDPANLPLWWPQDLIAGTRDVTGTIVVPLMTTVPTAGQPSIRMKTGYTLIHDGVMVEYIVFNDTPTTLQVGLRTLIDALFGGATGMDGSYIVLDDGSVITAETKIPDPQNPGLVMPRTWVSYDDPDTPVVAVRGTIEGSEVYNPSIATSSAGPPDEIQFGQFRNVGMNAQFDFTPNPAASLLNEDWAYGVKWAERGLQPGQSRRYVTYYGLGAASVDYDPPYALAGYAPPKLQVMTGDDPSTPEVEAYYLADLLGNSPFAVTALLDNFGPAPLINASVRISLPTGLELSPDTQPRTISLGVINRNQAPLPQAQWMVRASALRPGRAEIKFTGPAGKVITRTVNIPALPLISALPSQLGLEMVSVPYEFVNSDASNVFGSLTDSVYPGGQVGLWRWHPTTAEYRAYPDPWTGNVSPGKAYWLLNQNRETVILPGTATPLPANQTYAVALQAGWNQIGNPFVVPLAFDKVRVIGPQGVEWSMADAITRGILLPVLYSYNAEENRYEWPTSMQQNEVVPYQGYWVLAYSDMTLLFPPPTLFAPASSAPSVAAEPDKEDGWRVGLQVAAAGQVAGQCSFGASANAADGADLSDVPRPPRALRPGPVLDAYFKMPGESSMPYLVDIKSDEQNTQTWNFAVLTEAVGAPVAIRWPRLCEELPEGLAATLEDVSGGRNTYMRTSTGYTYNSGTGGVRQFRIVVRPRAATMLGLMGVTCAAADGGGLMVAYSLTTAAKVDVEVRNIAGRLVRQVVAGKDCAKGQNTIAWDGRGQQGSRVPAGLYVVQVTARSPETGESMSVISTARISR